jgi:hypothetical protein
VTAGAAPTRGPHVTHKSAMASLKRLANDRNSSPHPLSSPTSWSELVGAKSVSKGSSSMVAGPSNLRMMTSISATASLTDFYRDHMKSLSGRASNVLASSRTLTRVSHVISEPRSCGLRGAIRSQHSSSASQRARSSPSAGWFPGPEHQAAIPATTVLIEDRLRQICRSRHSESIPQLSCSQRACAGGRQSSG